jgi:hypothetical protein
VARVPLCPAMTRRDMTDLRRLRGMVTARYVWAPLRS